MTTPIDEYIRALDHAATGRSSRRPPRILREVRDHLEDAAAAGEDDGLSRREAEREAVSDFGDVQAVAPEYRAAIGLTRVRGAAIALLALVSAQPLVWAWWDGHRPDAGESGGLSAVLNDVVAVVGTAYVVGCPVLFLLCAFLLRGRDLTVPLTRVLGGFAITIAAAVALLAVALNATGPNATDMAFTAGVVFLPMCAVLVSATRSLRLTTT